MDMKKLLEVAGITPAAPVQADEFKLELNEHGHIDLLDGENTIRVSMPHNVWHELVQKYLSSPMAHK